MKSRGSAATSEVVAIGAVDGGGDLEIVTSIEGRRGASRRFATARLDRQRRRNGCSLLKSLNLAQT